MSLRKFIFGMLFFLTVNFLFGVQVSDTTRRFGIFIGANNGGRERVTLRYAVTDARSMLNVFREMGGIGSDDYILLVEPSVREINSRLDAIHTQVLRARGTNRRTEIIFYYSGHSDEEGLLLNREKYSYRELRDRINNIPADMRIVILDSCASGAFTRLKGGEPALPFLFDSSFTAEGHAFLTSSSANEVSQESDRIGASFFTHSLVAGLRGAADSVGDGRVTLNELYRFAYAETIARTETSLFGTQHPSYDIQISGTGDLVLTDISQTSAGIVFEENMTGRLSIRNNRDQLIVEINKTARLLELGLEPGLYRITLQNETDLLRAEVTLVEGQRTLVTMGSFSRLTPEPTRRRGGNDTEVDNFASLPKTTLYSFFFNVVHEPFPFPLIGLVNIAIGNHNIFQAGLINWNTGNFNGFQAGIINTVGDDFNGFQAGIININTGNFNGFQTGIINTVAGDFSNFQAGIINAVSGDFSGFQAGIVNTVGSDFSGFQAGIINTIGGDFSGFQTGIINTNTGETKGIQLGIINYTDSIEGIPIGLISIVRNGGYRAVEFSFSEFHTYNMGFKIGVDRFYTTIHIAYNHTNEFSWGNFATGLGFGSILPIGKTFFFNPELNSLTVNQWGNLREVSSVNLSSFATYFGINLGRFSLAAAPSVTWVYTGNAEMPKPNFSLHSYDFNDNHHFVIGLRAAARLRF
jgi:hypothetical protein